MGHPKRNDEPGAWHHLMNRGIGHRTMFDNDADARGFLALVARVAHEGLLCPVAFCLLPTHFHLLAWSPTGRLAEAMQYLEGIYSRGFNVRRGRDGGLVRARYRSKVVQSDAYRRALIGYIDQNPVEAKLVAAPRDYPFGSARLYARSAGPAWLSREWLEEFACRFSGLPEFGTDAYDRTFGGPRGAARSRWIRSAINASGDDCASLDALIRATPDYVRRWLDERALLADGAVRHAPVVDVESVEAAVAAEKTLAPDWSLRPRGRARPAWTIIGIALLRELAGQTHRQIASRATISESAVRKICDEHRRLLDAVPEFADASVRVAQCAIRLCHGN